MLLRRGRFKPQASTSGTTTPPTKQQNKGQKMNQRRLVAEAEAEEVVIEGEEPTRDNNNNNNSNKNESTTSLVKTPTTTTMSTTTTSTSTAMDRNVEVTVGGKLFLSSPAPWSDGHSDDDNNNNNNNNETKKDDVITKDSDLRKGPKKIVIVTTASLPWRTGTAVNPLLRALALQSRGHCVTLVIPWLSQPDQRQKLYGKQHEFRTCEQQEIWIRDYCVTRCYVAPSEAAQLQIKFWQGSYNAAFGSIFPTEDICALIPRNEADVVILEEPEHLNWFRGPMSSSSLLNKTKKKNNNDASSSKNNKKKKPKVATTTTTTVGGQTTTTTTKDDDIMHNNTAEEEHDDDDDDDYDEERRNVLGWASKFPHVVGILHTNYAAYVRQYNMATSFVTARALNSLSSLVIQSYCHVVIRLSSTLPALLQQPLCEVTSNVHGVGSAFLEPDDDDDDDNNNNNNDHNNTTKTTIGHDDSNIEQHTQPILSRVYFVGKIIWAKGFDNVLEVQERFKDRTGQYFPIDIYGKGDDEDSIRLAFHGRRGSTEGGSRPISPSPSEDDLTNRTTTTPRPQQQQYSFEEQGSLRDQVEAATFHNSHNKHRIREASTNNNDDASSSGGSSNNSCEDDASASSGVLAALSFQAPPLPEVLGKLTEQTVQSGAETAEAAMKLVESVLQRGIGSMMNSNQQNNGNNDKSKVDGVVPATIPKSQSDVSPKTSPTRQQQHPTTRSPRTTSPLSSSGHAVRNTATTTTAWSPKSGTSSSPTSGLHQLLPARSFYKWRKHPIPAHFWGVKDHVDLKRHREQCIFLNMSTTEVLCTTSAEALAMGKFVILPKHPSNEFFYDFPNCLVYDNLDECVAQLLYAFEHDPQPLSEDHRHALSWEGATERLYQAAAITRGQAKERERLGLRQEQEKAARNHVDMVRKSQFVAELFSGKVLKKFSSLQHPQGQESPKEQNS